MDTILIDQQELSAKILFDQSRLKDIYTLRVEAYKNSPNSSFLDEEKLKNGWFDELDERSDTIHWIIEDQEEIIASARLVILDKTSDLKDLQNAVKKFQIASGSRFVYYSRLVIHQNYRNLGLSRILDSARLQFLNNREDIKFTIAWAIPQRHKALRRNGFKHLGDFEYYWSNDKYSDGMNVGFFMKATSVLNQQPHQQK